MTENNTILNNLWRFIKNPNTVFLVVLLLFTYYSRERIDNMSNSSIVLLIIFLFLGKILIDFITEDAQEEKKENFQNMEEFESIQEMSRFRESDDLTPLG